jgi:hypothetical protein
VTPPDDSSAYEDPDWEVEYVKCPRWSELWKYRMQPEGVWPENVKFSGPYLLAGYKVAVPTGLQSIIIRKHHSFLAHAGFARLWHHMDLTYTWADRAAAKKVAKQVMGQCIVCQACNRPTRLKGCIEHHPIPPVVMYSVALDVFQMNKETHKGKEYECMVVCVDRHSGWIFAVPCLYKGLTGAKDTQLMLDQWRPYGIPSIITSDQDDPVISAWWKTMCGPLGI